MRTLLNVFRITGPAIIGLLIALYSEEPSKTFLVAIFGIILSIHQAAKDGSEKAELVKKFDVIHLINSKLINRFNIHINNPHPIAVATITTTGTVAIGTSRGVSSAVDCGSNEMVVHIINPDNLKLVPSVNIDALGKVTAELDPTERAYVLIKWADASPERIYLTVLGVSD